MDNQLVVQFTWISSSIKECLHYSVYKHKIPPQKRGDTIIRVSVKDLQKFMKILNWVKPCTDIFG